MGKVNQKIRNAEPKKYLASIPPERLEQQFVPLEHDLWDIRNYEVFLKRRVKLMLTAINGLLDDLGLKYIECYLTANS